MTEVDKFSNLFAKEAKDYHRDVGVIEHYISDASLYLHIQTGKPVEECVEFIKTNLRPGGKFEFKDPNTIFLLRGENGDRDKKQTTLSKYIGHTLANKEIMAPTFTTYVPATRKQSVLSYYIAGNIKKRAVAKKQMFAAKAAGNKLVESIKKIEQTGRKLGNNAVSGMHVSASTPAYNPTAHSTLTSTCRSTSAYGNANNEKFLSGNRHYFNLDVVLNNIVSIINHVDYAKIEAVMTKYGLHYPTTQEVMECIRYSTQLYWWNRGWMDAIMELVSKLTPLQCAAFVYVGDAYHLMKHNDVFMRTFITRLSDKIVGTIDNADEVLSRAPDNYRNLAHQICYEETVKVEPGNYSSIKGTQAYQTLACTINNIADTIVDYRDVVESFWMTSNLPASVAHFPASIRRSALTSDTDSTIFTVQDWILWYGGSVRFTPRIKAVYASMVFLTSATITHVLATMSANFGIIEEHIFKIAMKSEFMFDAFIPTQLGKHYYACISCQEGLVFDKLDYEIKGAQLKSANAPREVVKDAKEMMKSIISSVLNKGSISIHHWLNHVADVERNIIEHIKGGGLKYFRATSIKDAGSYAGKKEDSPYANHFLWNQVFGPKYGEMPDPPYGTYKISVTTTTPTKLNDWLDSMEDKELAGRFRAYLMRHGKNNITTFNLPADILSTSGIPKEVADIIDYDRIVVDICRIYYILLETLGYYALGDKVKRLVSSEGWGNVNPPEVTSIESS